MKNHGQILLPGLAAFLCLLGLFFGVIAEGRIALARLQLDMAASAAALSGARAQAQLLNKCAAHNLEANGFVNARFQQYGEVQIALKDPFEVWLEEEELKQNWSNMSAFWNGMKGFTAGVASHVAKLNGADTWKNRGSLDLRLQLDGLNIVFMDGVIPVGGGDYDNVYYSRLWGYDRRKAQPPHEVICEVKKGPFEALAAARVFLDVSNDDTLNNGGFPREQGEDWYGDIEIQSFFPQFNARLISVPLTTRLMPI